MPAAAGLSFIDGLDCARAARQSGEAAGRTPQIAEFCRSTLVPRRDEGPRQQVLDKLGLGNRPDNVDAVYALLDDETASWFPSAPEGTKFSDGASTAHIGCHVEILQRGGSKLDREGRDY